MLSWELNHPERETWSNELFDQCSNNLTSLSKAKDLTLFCDNYEFLNNIEKTRLWCEIMIAICYFESGFNPLSESVDVGSARNRNTWSVGLFQVSQIDQEARKLHFRDLTYLDLKDPLKNIKLAVAIMADQIDHSEKIIMTKGDKRIYWAVILKNGRYQKIAKIIERVKKNFK